MELLVVIAIIGILASLLLPAISQSKARAKRIWCVNNLHEIGIGFHLFAHDHNGHFPMSVPVSEGGSQDFVQSGDTLNEPFYFGFQSFAALSNSLQTPNILVCPADTRKAAARFSTLQNSNLSYFVGVTADFSKPESILAGDRNLSTVSRTGTTLLSAGPGTLRWTEELHRFKGNVLFSDDHVEEWNDHSLASAGAVVLSLPTVPHSSYSPPSQLAYNPAPPSLPQSHAANTPAGAGPSNPSPSTTASSHSYASRQTEQFNREQESVYLMDKTNVMPATTNVADYPAATNDDAGMSSFDRHMVKVIRGAFGWGYFLLLLLLLLIALLELWRRWNKRKKKNAHPLDAGR